MYHPSLLYTVIEGITAKDALADRLDAAGIAPSGMAVQDMLLDFRAAAQIMEKQPLGILPQQAVQQADSFIRSGSAAVAEWLQEAEEKVKGREEYVAEEGFSPREALRQIKGLKESVATLAQKGVEALSPKPRLEEVQHRMEDVFQLVRGNVGFVLKQDGFVRSREALEKLTGTQQALEVAVEKVESLFFSDAPAAVKIARISKEGQEVLRTLDEAARQYNEMPLLVSQFANLFGREFNARMQDDAQREQILDEFYGEQEKHSSAFHAHGTQQQERALTNLGMNTQMGRRNQVLFAVDEVMFTTDSVARTLKNDVLPTLQAVHEQVTRAQQQGEDRLLG